MLPNLSGSSLVRRRVLGRLAAILAMIAATLAVTASPARAAVLPTTTTLGVSNAQITAGDTVTLTATVKITGVGGLLVTPSGTVAYAATTPGGAVVQLGTAPVTGCLLTLSQCVSKLTTSALPVGTVTVTARYGGDAVTQPSSGTAQVNVAPRVTEPAAPTLTAVSEVGSVRLHWVSTSDGGSPVTSYELYRSPSSGGALTKIASGLPSGDYQDTTLPVGATYFYKATTVSAAGESGFSNEASGEALPLTGPTTHTTTTCTPGTSCTAPVISASAGGTTTSLGVSTTASSATHVLTSGIGGDHLQGCGPVTPRWYSTTFNDTSTDAYKTVEVVLKGAAADYMTHESGWKQQRIGCLGLGTPWRTTPSEWAQWSAADGLYVGRASYCKDMGVFQVGGDGTLFSQPCLVVSSHGGVFNPDDPNDSGHDREFSMTYHLPPGDGRISGSG
jgi:hypothetical protein